MKRQTENMNGEDGFTLVELMITLAMSGIIVAAVYSAHIVQQKTYFTQGQVVEMQQNIRAALEVMASDIRMATYDKGGDAGADIVEATKGRLRFTMDLNNDGDTADANEDIELGFSNADDANKDGVLDAAFSSPLRRNNQPIAESIYRLEFNYILDDDSEMTNPTGAGREDDIEAVTISILAVADQRDPKFTNTSTYTAASGGVWDPPDDNFRRRMLSQTVNIRNRSL